jgi:hypothetical protein
VRQSSKCSWKITFDTRCSQVKIQLKYDTKRVRNYYYRYLVCVLLVLRRLVIDLLTLQEPGGIRRASLRTHVCFDVLWLSRFCCCKVRITNFYSRRVVCVTSRPSNQLLAAQLPTSSSLRLPAHLSYDSIDTHEISLFRSL